MNTAERREEILRILGEAETPVAARELAARFGVSINYSVPNRKEFQDIVMGLARRQLRGAIDEAALLAEANRWELRHGGISGRTAQQFINYLAGKEPPDHDHPG